MTRFEVGQTYYGSLSCAHSSFPVTCVKRTDKTVWFEHATLPHAYKPARSKVRSWSDGSESASFHRWSSLPTPCATTAGTCSSPDSFSL